jgi:hypothetical protein
MSADDALTSIAVHTSTLRLLQEYKIGGKTYEEVILGFIEQYPPQRFLEEMVRRAKERITPGEAVYRKVGI